MNEIQLNTFVIPAVPEITQKIGTTNFEVTDKKMVIKIGDTKLFEDKPNSGKKWDVTLQLTIKETNI